MIRCWAESGPITGWHSYSGLKIWEIDSFADLGFRKLTVNSCHSLICCSIWSSMERRKTTVIFIVFKSKNKIFPVHYQNKIYIRSSTKLSDCDLLWTVILHNCLGCWWIHRHVKLSRFFLSWKRDTVIFHVCKNIFFILLIYYTVNVIIGN